MFAMSFLCFPMKPLKCFFFKNYLNKKNRNKTSYADITMLKKGKY